MDENRLTASLRDELGLAIEAAASVTPSPSLAAQVRARVDRERATPAPWLGWPAAALGAAAAVAVALVIALWPNEREPTDSARLLAASPITSPVPYAGTAQPAPAAFDAPRRWPGDSARASSGTVQRASASTLSRDAAALRDYVAYLRRVRVDTSLGETVRPATGPLELPAISIDRISIDPLPKLEAVTGERQ